MEKTLANLDSYQAEYYRRLAALPYFTQIAPVIECFLAAIVERGEFYTRAQTPVLADILEAGSIKSMAETNSGTTLGGIATRREVTASLFGCDTAALSAADYPKYGFLSQADARRDLLINAPMAMQYGDVSIRLRKNRMMHRTTLCVGNSVNMGNSDMMVPTRTDKIRATCITGLAHAGKPQAMPNPMAFYYYLATKILRGELNADNFAGIDRICDDCPMPIEYFELQYHGGISLRDDVERIDVIPSTPEDTDLLNSLKPKFNAIGIPLEIHNF